MLIDDCRQKVHYEGQYLPIAMYITFYELFVFSGSKELFFLYESFVSKALSVLCIALTIHSFENQK